MALLCLGAAPAARADTVNTSTTVCTPCYASNDGYGSISVSSAVAASCTISGSVASAGAATGYWTIEYYTIWSESMATSANVFSDASAYGIYYGMTYSSSGSADCNGNSSGITQDTDGYDYAAAGTNSAYFQ
jgi:hypothetical protein